MKRVLLTALTVLFVGAARAADKPKAAAVAGLELGLERAAA